MYNEYNLRWERRFEENHLQECQYQEKYFYNTILENEISLTKKKREGID